MSFIKIKNERKTLEYYLSNSTITKHNFDKRYYYMLSYDGKIVCEIDNRRGILNIFMNSHPSLMFNQIYLNFYFSNVFNLSEMKIFFNDLSGPISEYIVIYEPNDHFIKQNYNIEPLITHVKILMNEDFD